MREAAVMRTHALAEERPYLLLFVVAAATLFFGFITQAAGSAYLHWRADPMVLEYRTTLTYTSALVGDAILLPVVNVMVVSQLWIWRRAPRMREVVAAVASAALITLVVHLYQAANAILNWTMPAPYEWTPLGYVHAAFMFSELSLLLFFWGQVGRVAKERPRAIFSHRVVVVVLCSLFFLRLLLGDYGYFA